MFDLLPSLPPEHRWRNQVRPLPVVVSIIRREIPDSKAIASQNLYLLIHRNSEPYYNRWALVGGKWDFGETLAAAVTREVQEETGLVTNFVALRGLVNERLAPVQVTSEKAAHFLIFVCQVDAPEGDAREQAEGKVAWFNRAEIDQLHEDEAIIPSDYAMLRHFSGDVALPYVEVTMLSGDDRQGGARLLAFEQID
jgi:ADP-ribose pyrophosphatase YjhB (NUDIX family)